MIMISCRSLTKRYGTLCAVEGLNLDVPVGEICALLGPNPVFCISSAKEAFFNAGRSLVSISPPETEPLDRQSARCRASWVPIMFVISTFTGHREEWFLGRRWTRHQHGPVPPILDRAEGNDYPSRRAMSGSMRAARRAGMIAAASATAISVSADIVRISGSL